MPDKDFIYNIRLKYPELHPLLFSRAVERARNNTELFDIVDSIPKFIDWESPMRWDEKERRYMPCSLFKPFSKLDL